MAITFDPTAATPTGTVVVTPPYIARALSGGAQRVIALAGFPSGRHHSLVKAAEARLAVQYGAEEVWVACDGAVADPNALLADLVAIRESCPAPARLGLISPAAVGYAQQLADSPLATLAARAGYDCFITAPAAARADSNPPDSWPLPVHTLDLSERT
ncbi:deoxyribose-phosphate aldolase [Corynebacterium lizhenjunii]|uniref:deoxyribose-phosphate aldolase n=1 Tax=Corynebacterium lizhenjunii TaxID=2709394 RepID=UPI0013EA5744|nr:deoxyribose-phosphate aldolase [Corynebacterium lizhenjunii]